MATSSALIEPSNARDDGILLVAARVIGLCSLAVTAPILDVLGANPTFFVAHDIDGANLVVFALVIALAPGAALALFLAFTQLVAPRVAPIIIASLIGALAALAVVPIMDRTVRMSTTVSVALVLIVGAVSALAYRRWRAVRGYTTLLAPAPVILLILFLFVSPSSALVGGTEGVEASILRGSTTPVVVVLFDELPLGLLLDERGSIDAARYPGFASLAGKSTWYPEAVTVSPWTHLAVPAILTGTLPSDPVPVAATHPRSLFTLLAPSHRLRAIEPITEICPSDLCERQTVEDTDLTSDTSIVFLHSLLPDGLAEDWLPAIGERWAGFTDELTTASGRSNAGVEERTYDDFRLLELFRLVGQRDKQLGAFADFLSAIGPSGDRPDLWFNHVLLPHLPYQYLADGRAYDGSSLPAQSSAETWSEDSDLVANAVQRLAIQAKVVDSLVTSTVERLEAQGIFDDALVVVAADHGITFESGHGARGTVAEGEDRKRLSARTRNELLPVPLFIKYPGQRAGTIDDRDAQTIDILPTIVEALGLEVPGSWQFDGRSLLGGQHSPRVLRYTEDTAAERAIEVDGPIDAEEAAAFFRSILGPGGREHDLYRIEPYGALIGEPVDGIVSASPVGTFTLDAAAKYANVDLNGEVPALIEARVTGLDEDDWIAIAVNGTVAGTGPVYGGAGTTRMIAMLDPELLRPGRNLVDLFRIDGLQALRPLSRT